MANGMQEEKKFGDYKLIRRLAVGGMGEIWLAERKGISGFSKRVVIKSILECFVDDPELVEMFLDEGRIAADLNHPNIAQTFDLGRVGSTYYIAMEYIEGRDLRQLLLTNVRRKQFIPLNLILRVIAEGCEGMHYAHTVKTPRGHHAGIIHRDISPQNILVTFDGTVKIVDFGIAKATQRASKTRSGVLKGKYAYMSPEQVRGMELDPRSDQFSLGVVMYELVTARRLFKRDSELGTLDAVLEAVVPSPSRLDGSVPEEVEGILMRALAQDREQRFPDMRSMQMAIEEVMLSINLPASSAHVAAYMDEMFLDRDEPSLAGNAKINRAMQDLPGVKEKGQDLERTGAYTPGLDLAQVSRHTRNPTRNLVMTGQLQAQPQSPRSSGLLWAIVGLLAVFIGLGGWFVISSLLSDKVQGGNNGLGLSNKPFVIDGGASLDAGQAKAPVDGGGAELNKDGGVQRPSADKGKGKPVVRVVKRKGSLNIETVPASKIFLGKIPIGVGSVRGYRLKAGVYTVKAVARPGSAKTLRVRVRSGRTTSKRITFGKGKLRVVAMPWANLWVDGKKKGQTPIPAIDLLEGAHKVRLHNPQLGQEKFEVVKIKAGKETLVRVDWR
ncbi:MAG: serine/threonine protein kinase [Deltaproteobacteria bacterium]|nr:serine/threonine protein kinase [Deltaproteobacteria bacterium]